MFLIIIIIFICIFLYFYYRSQYKVFEIENILTPDECDELILYAKNKDLRESAVLTNNIDKTTHVDEKNRTSKTLWIKDKEHPLAAKIANLTETLTGLSIETQEPLQIAHYDTGGKFNPHYDACNCSSKAYCDKINRYAGQRRFTLLIYLNDDFKGGETVFSKIGITIKPKKGKAILFQNTTEYESIIGNSIHCGNTVIEGEKWIATKWSHSRKYPV